MEPGEELVVKCVPPALLGGGDCEAAGLWLLGGNVVGGGGGGGDELGVAVLGEEVEWTNSSGWLRLLCGGKHDRLWCGLW